MAVLGILKELGGDGSVPPQGAWRPLNVTGRGSFSPSTAQWAWAAPRLLTKKW